VYRQLRHNHTAHTELFFFKLDANLTSAAQ